MCLLSSVTYCSCRVESYYLILVVTTMAPMANGWYVVCMVTHSPELSVVQLDLGVWGVTVGIRDRFSSIPVSLCVLGWSLRNAINPIGNSSEVV